ncbi:MAG: transmembrane sensor [Parvicella sp.]|jgi:transmembrane sensor
MTDPDKAIYAYLTSNLSTWEIRELINWLSEAPENRQKFKSIRAYWENTGVIITLERASIDKAYNKLSQKVFDPTAKKGEKESKIVVMHNAVKKRRIVWLSIAASIVLLIGVFFITDDPEIPTENRDFISVIVKENPKGRKSQIFLPDGSKVWLNAESRIEYHQTFGKADRNIKLQGEAYFDVEKNGLLPFVVSTSQISVTALGTEFNVSAFLDESSIEVLLTEGKVLVTDLGQDNDDEYLIIGESIEYSKTERIFTKNMSDFDHQLAWKNNTLSFQDASEKEVIRTLERWYGVQIDILNGSKSKSWKYNSRFENESLENVLNSMGHVKKFDFTIRGESVTITYKN